jgi:DNA-binding transcriptional LysR family regulator
MAVREGSLDVALVGEETDPSLFVSQILWTEQLCLIADAAQEKVRSARDVRGRALLVFKSGCAYRARLEQWMTAARIVPQRVVEIASYHALIACAAAGVGVSAVPLSLLQQLAARDSISVHRLPDHLARVNIRLIGRREETGTAREQFARFIAAWTGASAGHPRRLDKPRRSTAVEKRSDRQENRRVDLSPDRGAESQ